MSNKHPSLPILHFLLLNAFEQENIWDHTTGNNAKNILVLLAENQEVSDDLLKLLNKILEAVNVNTTTDIALLKSTHEQAFSFTRMAQKKPIQKVLSFGLPASQMGLHWRYTLYSPFDRIGHRFLFAERLSLIQNDRQRKLKLWKALQEIFTP